MAEYRVEIIRPAVREIQNLEQTQARRILASVEALASQPRPRQSRKLTGTENSYRLRVGVYRVLYQVDDDQRTVIVFAIGHRRQVYR